MKLSIVILSWNSKDFLMRCLQSVGSCTIQPREVIVADNGSRDGSRELLLSMQQRGEVRAILNLSNHGIGPARNQAFAVARGEYFLSLDVDTEVIPGAIETLLQTMESNPNVGLSGPRLQSPKGERQDTCRDFPTLQTKICRQLPFSLRRVFLKKAELLDWDHQGLRYVDYVIGACHMIRRSALEQVGPYDPLIFYGPEDVDLCLRMWLAGWKVIYNGRALIIHTERRITKKWSEMFNRTTRAHIKGLAYYFWKHGYLFRPPHAPSKQGVLSDPISLRRGSAPTHSDDLGCGRGNSHSSLGR
jgi:GT2 family glycosyltransferase